jgi:hypothetical protein
MALAEPQPVPPTYDEALEYATQLGDVALSAALRKSGAKIEKTNSSLVCGLQLTVKMYQTVCHQPRILNCLHPLHPLPNNALGRVCRVNVQVALVVA